MVSKAERLQKQYEVSKARADSAKAALSELRRTQNKKAQKEARKKRNQALFESAECMIMADLLVSESGLPAFDKGALLGGLTVVANTLKEGPETKRFQEWKSVGDAVFEQIAADRLRILAHRGQSF